MSQKIKFEKNFAQKNMFHYYFNITGWFFAQNYNVGKCAVTHHTHNSNFFKKIIQFPISSIFCFHPKLWHPRHIFLTTIPSCTHTVRANDITRSQYIWFLYVRSYIGKKYLTFIFIRILFRDLAESSWEEKVSSRTEEKMIKINIKHVLLEE